MSDLGTSEVVARIAARLRERGESLAVAESAAGGLISNLLTNQPGSSAWFRAGIVAYSNDSKRDLVGVDAALLDQAGAVSVDVAHAMARGIRARATSTWALAETGIAGPRGTRRSVKPSGLAHLAVVGELDGRKVEATRTIESGCDDRLTNKRFFAESALRLLLAVLAGAEGASRSDH